MQFLPEVPRYLIIKLSNGMEVDDRNWDYLILVLLSNSHKNYHLLLLEDKE